MKWMAGRLVRSRPTSIPFSVPILASRVWFARFDAHFPWKPPNVTGTEIVWKDGKNLCFSEVVVSCSYSLEKAWGCFTSTALSLACSSSNLYHMIDPKETTKQVGEDNDCEETTEVYFSDIYIWWSMNMRGGCYRLSSSFTFLAVRVCFKVCAILFVLPSILSSSKFPFLPALNTIQGRIVFPLFHPTHTPVRRARSRRDKGIDVLERKCIRRCWIFFIQMKCFLCLWGLWFLKEGGFLFFLEGYFFSFLISAADGFCIRRLRTWIGFQGRDRSLCSSLVLHLPSSFVVLNFWGRPLSYPFLFWFKVHWWGDERRRRWWRG
jgi:hypothetical protein